MKIRLADYVAEFLVKKGVSDVFSIVGGGAMHLNDGFGHNPDIKCSLFKIDNITENNTTNPPICKVFVIDLDILIDIISPKLEIELLLFLESF